MRLATRRFPASTIGPELATRPAYRFRMRRGIGMLADDGRHGEGRHDQGNMAVPAVPRADLVVIEAGCVIRGLDPVLDRPSVAFDPHQCFHGGTSRTTRVEEKARAPSEYCDGSAGLGPDPAQGSANPRSRDRPVRHRPSHGGTRPCPHASRKVLPGIPGQVRGDTLHCSGNGIRPVPGVGPNALR